MVEPSNWIYSDPLPALRPRCCAIAVIHRPLRAMEAVRHEAHTRAFSLLGAAVRRLNDLPAAIRVMQKALEHIEEEEAVVSE